MNAFPDKIIRTNKTSTTLVIGAITLMAGLLIGAAVAEASGSSMSKNQAATTTNEMAQSNSNLSGNSLDEWNPFQQMRQMQSQMDQMFNQMTKQFHSEPGFSGFIDNPGYSLSLDVRDMKDHYEVHAYLPDANASNVHVNLKNDRMLQVEVNSTSTESSNESMNNSTNAVTHVSEWGQYEQTVQLPTPVKADQMKINRKGHELTIIIPKK